MFLDTTEDLSSISFMERGHNLHHFGPFCLDEDERVLLRDGRLVPLPAKVVNTLIVLVRRNGHVVEKDVLMEEVWPNDFVEEGNLAHNIFLLRRALGESTDCPRYIETVFRRGYRFIAAARIQNGEDDVRRETSSKDRPQQEKTSGSRESEVDLNSSTRLAAGLQAEHVKPHYRHYVRGRYYWSKYTVEGLNKAIYSFLKAISIDPDYAPSYAGLADCYYRLSNIHLAPWIAIPKAKVAALKAINLDNTIVEAHTLLGLIKMFYDCDWSAAENEFNQAINLSPDCPLAHKRYGWALGMLGRFDEAITEMNKALDLRPQSSDIRVGFGIVLYLARRYDDAIEQAESALDTEPEFFPAHVLLGLAHAQQRRLTRAIGELRVGSSLADVPWALGCLGYVYGLAGRRQEASNVLSELEERSKRAYVSPFAIALIHTGLGQKEQAIEALEKTYEDRNELLGFLWSSPELDSLRSEERFVVLMHRSRPLGSYA